jgi:Lar family restriction alleviation protein
MTNSNDQDDHTQAVERLKPCPFCGSSVRLMRLLSDAGRRAGDPPAYDVECNKCWVWGRWSTEAEAIAAWNRRAEPADLLAAIARVEELRSSRDQSILPDEALLLKVWLAPVPEPFAPDGTASPPHDHRSDALSREEVEAERDVIRESDIDWLRRAKDVGHCGEGTMERRARDEHNDRVDRILAALASKLTSPGDSGKQWEGPREQQKQYPEDEGGSSSVKNDRGSTGASSEGGAS